MSKIDEAKKLLKKAMEINDSELISMANKLLDEATEVPNRPTLVNRNDDSFLSPITNEDAPTKKAVPVNEVKNRVNEFHDDGSDAADVTTPDFEPTSRRREPFKSVKQNCQQCGQTGLINPTHRREYYVCDKCIRSKMR